MDGITVRHLVSKACGGKRRHESPFHGLEEALMLVIGPVS